MKANWLFVILLVALVTVGCQKKAGTAPVTLDSSEKKISYMLGLKVAQDMKSMGIAMDMASFNEGFHDSWSGAKSRLTDEEINAALQAFQLQARQKQQERFSQTAQKNLQEGTAFLAENAKKADIKTTPSGLQYKITTMGKGAKPKETDTVRVHYRGYFPNGQEFDSSYKRNQPAEFLLKGVIKGWTEGLQLLPVGSKCQLFIPSALGYGENGSSPDIGPNQVLIFDVELLAILPSPKSK